MMSLSCTTFQWSSSRATAMWRLLILLLILFDANVSAYFSGRFPIVGEKEPVILRRKAGCYMDGKHYGFRSRWSPVFIPQGLMVCIRCECLPVENKGVLQAAGETMCRNIKDLCPKPSCPTPVLRPGKCCKACPEDEEFEDSFTFSPRAPTSNEVFSLDAAQTSREDNDFQALLVGRRVPGRSVRTRAVAAVRMTINKGSVHLSIRYTRLDRPKYLRVVDAGGKVLFQTPVTKSVNGERKVCGVWRKVPPAYQDYLRREKLHVVITTARFPTGVVGGRIKASNAANTETFSTLLVTSSASGEGAHATLAFDPRTKMAAYSITTEGVRRHRGEGGSFTISIMKGSHLIYRTRGTALPKTTRLSGTWRVSKRRHRKQLARGRLRMRVIFTDGQTLTGDIQPKQTCDSFQAVLSSGQTRAKRRSSSAGSAVVRLGENGRLHYSIRLSGLERAVSRIQLEGHNSRSRSKNVGKLHYSFVQDEKDGYDGWAHGTFKRLEAEGMYRLLNNQLYLSVSTGRNDHNELKGRLVGIGHHTHFHEKAVPKPVTLTPATEAARGGGATVWLSLGLGCVLHFDVLLTGKGKRSGPFGLLLGRHGNDSDDEIAVLRPPVGKRGEIIYQYRHVTGEVIDLSDDFFRDLDRGKAFLQINAKRRGQAVFKGNVTLPNNCWHFSNDMDSEMAEDTLQEGGRPQDFLEDTSPSCRFEGLFYSDGTAWIPDVDSACTTCSCVKGKTLCQKMTCPVPNCREPVHLDGRCCPSCPDEDASQTCQLGRDPRKYPLNSVWHPYLPSQGFTTCALCTCKSGGKADCEKLPCPVLECPRTEWVPSPTNPCCYHCGPKATTEPPKEEPQGDVNMEGTCNFLGEIKANGQAWHPNVPPFGYMKCFSCQCQDGEIKCHRLTCPKLRCARKIKRRNVCCEECAADQSNYPPGMDASAIAKKKGQIQGQGVCVFAGKEYKEGERWRPLPATPTDSTDCAVCKCVAGSTKCHLRCPKVCSQDINGHKCCKHCPERDNRRNSTNKQRKKKTKRKKKKKRKNRRQGQYTTNEGPETSSRKSEQGQGRIRKPKRRKGSKQRSKLSQLPSSQQLFAMLST